MYEELLEYIEDNVNEDFLLNRDIQAINTIRSHNFDPKIIVRFNNNERIEISSVEDLLNRKTTNQIRTEKLNRILK